MKRLFLFLLIMVTATDIAAVPLRLSIQSLQQQVEFHYQFEFAGKPQQLRFTIEQTRLNNHFRDFRALKPALLQQYIWRDLRAHAALYPGARLQRLPSKEALRYSLQLNDQAQLQQLNLELRQLAEQRTSHYLQQQYYKEIEMPQIGQVIIPDHQRLFQDSLNDLLPVATAWHQQLAQTPLRESLAILSNWIQQIPYQDLSDRNKSSGASFSTPLKLLQENRGDCDSKTVLLAALLRMLVPDLKLAIVYLQQHALLAVQLPALADDNSIEIAGNNYILVDATGPALLKPGQINAEYQMYTRNRLFAYSLL